VIVSNDKDMFQLVNDQVQVLHQAKEDVFFDAAKVKDFFGVPPEQVVDVLGLMGDASDNIPGAPGIGEKGARDLISRFNSLENLLANTSQVDRKTYRQSLEENREQILSSRQLATIDLQAPVTVDWAELKTQPPDMEALQSLFVEMGFQSLLKEFEMEPEKERPVAAEARASLSAIATGQEAARLLGQESAEPVFCCLELTAAEPVDADLLALAVCRNEKGSVSPSGWKVAFSEQAQVTPSDFKSFWDEAKLPKVIHNAKPAFLALERQQLALQGLADDTMLMSYLLQPNRSNHNFEEIVFALLGENAGADCEQRAFQVARLYAQLSPKLHELGLEKIYREVELPLVEVLAEMEGHGVIIDPQVLGQLSKEMEVQIDRLTKRIYELAGVEFNMNSPKQLGEILFDKLNLPAPKKLKKSGQYSTSVEILEQLSTNYELPRQMLEYRQLAKLKSGYVDALPKLVNPRTGRVHTSFNQTIAATGRLSSSNPNLQNIPIRSELGMKIRAAFVPAGGHVLLAADYSQIELRVLAHFSKDPVLIDSFRRGEDIHSRTAMEVFGVHPGMQTPELRRRAKAINFGIVYGQTAFGLAKELEVSNREAQKFIDSYFEHYRGVKEWIDETIAETRKTEISRTLHGRLRQIPDIRSKNPNLRGFAERTAVNSPIQGTAADLIKLAMIRIHHLLKHEKMHTRMLLQVHDELVFEVPEGEVEAAEKLVKREMETVVELAVPVVVDIGVGKNWMET
jgi:DNA polymerase-1